MNKGKKIALAILFDMLFLVAIVFAVSTILHGGDTVWKVRLAQVLIILLIPCSFYITYMSFSGDKYDKLPEELLEEDEEDDEAIEK